MNVAAIIGLNGMMQGMVAMHKATLVISGADSYNTELSKDGSRALSAMASMKADAQQVDKAAKMLKEANPQLGALLDIVT